MAYRHERQQATETLRHAGIANPARLARLIQDAIAFFGLDLSGLTVLTEAASGHYVVTPIIAAMAGADRVLALTRDSKYASAETVIAQTRALEELCAVEHNCEIYTQRSTDLFAQADIVTNLGFVRPIDAEAVGTLKPTAVISLMCEAWEVRSGDIDTDACWRKGIVVLGTNEDYPGLETFAQSGNLCLKMLFDAQIEVHRSSVVIVSRDKFGPTIQRALNRVGATAILIDDLRSSQNRAAVRGADALVVADYIGNNMIVGEGGDITPAELASMAPDLTLLQFAGSVDIEGLHCAGIACYPKQPSAPHRMAFTLAELGPRPVIGLHTAGFKVGETAARARHSGFGPAKAVSAALSASKLVQSLPNSLRE